MDAPLSKLAILCLCWFAQRKERGGSRSELLAATWSLGGRQQGRAEWKAALDGAIDQLSAAGCIELSTRGRGVATPQGESRAAKALGLPELPPELTFAGVRSRLATVALGMPPGAALEPDGLRAVVLSKHLRLPAQATSLPLIKNALAWRQAGLESVATFTRGAVLKRAFQEQLGPVKSSGESQALAQMAAKAAGARRTTTEELRLALLVDWLGAHDGPVSPETTPESVQTVVAPATEGRSASHASSLETFAARAVALAVASQSGRFGDRLVFVSAVLREARAAEPGQRISDEAFKRELLAAHNAGLLTLVRADLVEAMDPAEVAASEIRTTSATFHFVRIS